MAEHLRNATETTVLIWEYVTGGGLVGRPLPPSLAAEGAAIRRALVADFAAVAGVRVLDPVDSRCLDPWTSPPNVTQIIADPDHPIDLAALLKLCDLVLIIAPESDGILTHLAQQVRALGGGSLGSTPEAIAVCSDKLRLAEQLTQQGIPHPPTWAFDPADGWPAIAWDLGRFVIKPVDGAGSVDTFVLDGSAPFPLALRAYDRLLIQPYRAGLVCSASFLMGPDGQAHLLAVGRQRIAVREGGQVEYRGGELPIPFETQDLSPVYRVLELIPGLFGFVGVDFVVVEATGAVEVIEINPRVTTSIVGLVRLARSGTIARAWLKLVEPDDRFDMSLEVGKIATAPPVRFAADGSILIRESSTP